MKWRFEDGMPFFRHRHDVRCSVDLALMVLIMSVAGAFVLPPVIKAVRSTAPQAIVRLQERGLEAKK